MTAAGSVFRSFAVTICRAVIETVGDDHQTLTWIIRSTVSAMMTRVVGGRIGGAPPQY